MIHLFLAVLLAVGGDAEDGERASGDSLDTAMIETIVYSSDSLIFDPSGGDLILIGQARLDYRDMTLHSDTIRYESGGETITATGESELFDRGESITGTEMVYSLTSRKGRISGADSRYEFGFYHGESITRIGRNEFNIVDATFTTCEQDSAHYYFFSPEMKVFPDDKVIARPVYLYIEETPVLYFPFWIFPIRRGRTAGFTMPKFGQTTMDGRYLRDLGYYFVFSDYSDLWLRGDILEKSRFVLGLRERHRVRYLCNGSLNAEWRREFQTRRDRWMAFLQHLHDFPDGTSVRLQGEFLSDRSYLEETQQTPADRMLGEARSWISVNRYFGRLGFQGAMDRTSYLNVDPDTIPDEVEWVQELPDIRLTLTSAPLFSTPSDPTLVRPWHSIYWSAGAHYLSRDQVSEGSRATNSALRVRTALTGSSRLWGWLSFSPALQGTGTIYDRDRLGDRFPWWLHGSMSLAASTDIYGLFSTSMLGLSALRHTVSPSATISWAPESYLDPEGIADSDSADAVFYTFSDFSLPSGRSLLNLGLQNRLEGKTEDGGDIERFEIASLSLSTVVDLEAEREPFSPLAVSLELNPLRNMRITGNGSWDMYGEGLQDMSVSSSLRLSGYDRTLFPDSGITDPGLPIRMNLSHFYRFGLDESPDISKFRVSAGLDISPGWSIEYSAYYDALDESFISQSYTLRRDLHCWEAVFVRHISDVDSGFYFRINIMELPDIKLEQHVSNF